MIGAGAMLLLLASVGWFAWPPPVTAVRPVHVIDGDSLTITNSGERQTIRLRAIDAVEYRQICSDPARGPWPCGKEARAALERIAGKTMLHCELSGHDRYGRSIAACRTAAFPDGVDIAAEMVRAGWAVADGDTYLAEEGEAQARRRGIWRGSFTPPADWRTTQQRAAEARTTPGG